MALYKCCIIIIIILKLPNSGICLTESKLQLTSGNILNYYFTAANQERQRKELPLLLG